MEYKVAIGLALPIALGMAAIGSAMGLGRAVGSAMDAIARQPEMFMKILIAMTVGCAFIDTITIFAMFTVFAYLK